MTPQVKPPNRWEPTTPLSLLVLLILALFQLKHMALSRREPEKPIIELASDTLDDKVATKKWVPHKTQENTLRPRLRPYFAFRLTRNNRVKKPALSLKKATDTPDSRPPANS